MLTISLLQKSAFFRSINSMLLSDKSNAFIHRNACFLKIKHMLLSPKNHENQPVLSICFTFTCYLVPITCYRIAPSDSRLLRKVDKNLRRILTVRHFVLTFVHSFHNSIGNLPKLQRQLFTKTENLNIWNKDLYLGNILSAH